MAETDVLVTAAQLGPVIQERGAVAQQYWAATQAFQRARLGFRLRLQVAVGQFTACSPGDQGGPADGQQYQIVATWELVRVPLAEQVSLLQRAVPAVERAFNDAGWTQFQPSASSRADVVATRQGITLSLDPDPASTAQLPGWTPGESYTVTGACIPVTAPAAAEFGAVGYEHYGTVPTALPSIRIESGKLVVQPPPGISPSPHVRDLPVK
jgi:hypothetical protein